MPDIDLTTQPFFPYTDGQVPEAEDVNTLVYSPAVTPNSLEVINGRLTRANFDNTVFPLDRELVRKGHLSYGRHVGSTANLDVPAFLFGGLSGGTQLKNDDLFDVEALPVLAVRFYIPEGGATYVRLYWELGFLHDVGYDGLIVDADLDLFYARARLFLDGQACRPITRDVRGARTILRNNGTTIIGGVANGHPDTRWWTGSLILDSTSATALGVGGFLQEGWHTAEIRLGAQVREPTALHNNQVRVRARRMGYTVVK